MLATRWTPSRVRSSIRVEVLADVGPVELLASSSISPEQLGGGRLERARRLLVEVDHLQDALQVALEHRQVVADVGQRVVDLVGHPGAEQADRGELLRLGEHRPHPLPLGLVADRADELELAVELDGAERELERELLAVLLPSRELDGLAREAREPRGRPPRRAGDGMSRLPRPSVPPQAPSPTMPGPAPRQSWGTGRLDAGHDACQRLIEDLRDA